ncbi:MAG: YicC family protein [Lachnospiraceae bacterium]|nr:YicC family protein [Lachnospiraceae bacterium]
MIKSMTGYGRSEVADHMYRVSVEIKSVNNRYLDIGLRMPRQLNPLEAQIRAVLKEYMKRGKVDVYISYEDLTESNRTVQYNSRIAGEYIRHLKEMEEEFGIKNDISAFQLSRYPDVFTMEEESPDETQIWERLETVLRSAAEQFLQARIREGAFLRDDLLSKLDEMLENVEFIEKKSPVVVENYRRRLADKVRELLEDRAVEDSRIVQEVTIYADKVCLDEELVRLRSHILATRDALGTDEGVGRKLDFIAQEMNRESNTILSKSDDKEITDRAIELKTTVEKVREQIQNIE